MATSAAQQAKDNAPRFVIVRNIGTPAQQALRIIPSYLDGAELEAARAATQAKKAGHPAVGVIVTTPLTGKQTITVTL